MMHAAFEVPELIGLIARFMTPREMANCMATCKLLHAQFEQHRWRRLRVSKVYEGNNNRLDQDDYLEALWTRPSGAEAVAIMRNRHHLRHLTVTVFAHFFLRNLCVDKLSRPESGPFYVRSAHFKAAPIPLKIFLPAQESAVPYTAILAPVQRIPTSASTTDASSDTPPLHPPLAPLSVTNLRRLHIDIAQLAHGSCWRALDVTPTTMWALQLLDSNPLLTHLHLPASFLLYQWAIDAFLNMIDNRLLLLEHLTFGKNHMLRVSFENCPPLLHALCKHKRLKELHCLFNTTYSNYDHARYFELLLQPHREAPPGSKYFEVAPQDLLTEPSMYLKAVTLPRSHNSISLAMVLRFLNNCVPNLEDLEVPDFLQPAETFFEPLVMLGSSSLQHLRFEADSTEGVVPSVCIAALRCCKALKSFRTGFSRDMESVLKSLVELHAKTLEVISIHDTGLIMSELIQRLLRDCPRLKEFAMNKSTRNSGLKLSHAMTGQWACLGLRILRLTICRSVIGEHDANDEDDHDENLGEWIMQQQQEQQEDDNHGVNAVQDDAAMNDTAAAMSMSCGIVESVAKLYQQIGRLTQLEILDLRYNSIGDPNSVDFMGDLTLAGGLSFLSELKSLRQLVLISDLWTGMGQAEVEFMAECWPRLEVIAFGTSARIQDWNTPTFDHWRWLEKRILGLRLVFLEDDEKVWND